MARTPKPKARVRPRKGYVMVELNEEDRKKLEEEEARLSRETGVKVGLAGTLRSLLRRAKP
jgi:hypothetical protein